MDIDEQTMTITNVLNVIDSINELQYLPKGDSVEIMSNNDCVI